MDKWINLDSATWKTFTFSNNQLFIYMWLLIHPFPTPHHDVYYGQF